MARKRETLASEDISDLPPPTHRHPMSGEPIWDQHAVRAALASAPVADERGLPKFEQVWAEYEKKGYLYGEDALENVRFGFEIARATLASAPVADERNGSLISFAVSLAEETLGKSVTPKDYVAAGVFVEKERQARAALASAPVAGEVTDADIRAVFLAHGFTIKEGQTDLKPYVYAAARALLALAATPQASEAASPVAPWPDYAGNPIRHNDRIRHPDGTEGIVWHMDGHKDANDAWRVLYVQEGEIACLSRLNLQIGEKGQAVVVAAASEPAPPQASTIAWDAAQAMADELEVADLLAGFGQDPTGDHAVMVVRAVMERTKGQIAEAVLKFVQATDALHEAIERKTWTSGFKKEMTAGERIRCWASYREAREELIALLKD